MLTAGGMTAFDDDFTDPWSDAEVVLLQHGFVRNASLWRQWVPLLGRRFRVVRPDLPGIGRSPHPGPGHEFTTDEMVEGTVGLLDALGIERVHHVGEGIGGAVGTAVAVAHPDRVLTLTLLSEPVRVGADIQANHSAGFPTWAEAIETLGMRDWWVAAHTAADDMVGGPIDDHIADEVARVPPEVAIALSRWAPTWDLEDLLPHVTVPVLFMWAENAKWSPPDARAELAALAPRGEQHVVPGISSQLFHYAFPDLVVPEVVAFIDRHRGGGNG